MLFKRRRRSVDSLVVSALVSTSIWAGGGIYPAVGQSRPLPRFTLTGVAAPQASDGPVSGGRTACPQDAVRCPDGSVVLRTAPDCRMAACPGADLRTDPHEGQNGVKPTLQAPGAK